MKNNISGIYSITNVVNGKTYYGSSKNIRQRWHGHKYRLNTGVNANPHLLNAWRKYGKQSFRFEIVEEVPTNQLVMVEQQYLDLIKQIPEWFYNIGVDATASMRGRKASDETKRKMSIASPHQKWTKKQKLELSEIRKNDRNNVVYTFRNKFGGDVFVGTRRDFFRKYNLDRRMVRDLVKRRKMPSYKGWTLWTSR